MSEREILKSAADEAHRQVKLALATFFLWTLMLSAIVAGIDLVAGDRKLFPVLVALFVVVLAGALTLNVVIYDHRTRYGKE